MIDTTPTVRPALAGSTRRLLACGIVAAPLFFVVGFTQVLTRAGIDLRVHPFSTLSLGDLGWIQITNFVVCGLLFIACGVGMRRVLRPGPGGTAGPALIAAFGASMIGGGVFLADPAFGYPAGAPAGMPETISWHGVVHGIAFALGALTLAAAFVVFARRFARDGERGWVQYTVATAVVFVLLSAVGIGGGDFRIASAGFVLGWGWVSIVAASLRAR